jgi:hypothetical protein
MVIGRIERDEPPFDSAWPRWAAHGRSLGQAPATGACRYAERPADRVVGGARVLSGGRAPGVGRWPRPGGRRWPSCRVPPRACERWGAGGSSFRG